MQTLLFALVLVVATAEVERTIAHMEADIAFHQSQMRMFEKMLQDEQKKLRRIQFQTMNILHVAEEESS